MFGTNDTKLCRGCLSADRKLTSVPTGDLSLYYILLAEDQKLDANIPLLLCWECAAVLHRILIFRAQVQQAHQILEESLGLPPGKATLSSLTTQYKLEYDAVFEDTEPVYQPLFCKTKVPITVDKIVIPTKYKAQVTEKDVENVKITADGRVDDDYETEIKSDDDSDNDYNEDLYVSDRMSSSPEITIKKVTRKKLLDANIVKHSNLKDEKPKIKAAEPQCKPITINKLVKNTHVPVVKTPVIAKLELELQKFMQNAKNSKVVTISQRKTSKQKDKKKVSTVSDTKNAGPSKDTVELNNDDISDDDDNDDESESNAEDGASNHGRKKIKRENKRAKPESDPDFSLEEDEDEDSDSNNCKTKNDVPKENSDDAGKEKKKQKRYKKTIMRYKHIDDVISCFTEIEMSVDDLKSTLEKEDAVVDEKKPQHCNICGQRFQRYRTLKHHAYNLHKGKYPGQFRKGNFYNPPPTIPDKPFLWRCSVCSRMLRREHTLAHVNEYHHTQYFCNGEGCEWSPKGFWTKQDHDEHWIAIHKQFSCDICGARKRNKSSMESHMQRAHFRLPIPKQQCPHCDSKFVHRKALQKHVLKQHSEPEPAECRYCVECDVTFDSISKLQKHFYKHTRNTIKYPCPECDRVLANKGSYQNHYKLFHTGKTDYCCHICGKYFSKSQALDGHLKSHLNIRVPKTKPCTICGRMFQTNRILRQHIYTHTGERPYQCSHCDAAYTQPHCLRVHLAKQHGVDEVVRHLPIKRKKTTVTTVQNDQ